MRIGTSGGALVNTVMNLRFPKRVAVSQKGVSSMKLVTGVMGT
jgi:hypothetical protein